MSAIQVASLVLRQVKGAPLTNAEGDQNLTTLRDFCNALSDLISVALNTDGTLLDDSVATDAIADRAVTNQKLDLGAMPFFVDQGSPNNYMITPDPAPTSSDYVDGMVFFVWPAAGNTGPSTLQVGVFDAKPIYKLGGQDLIAGDILGHQIFAVVFYDDAFQMITSPATVASLTGGTVVNGDTIQSGSFSGVLVYQPSLVPLQTATNYGTPQVFTHALNAVPRELEICLQCITPELGYALGDTVPVSQFVDSTGKRAFAQQVNATTITITQLTAQPMVARVNNGGTGQGIGTVDNITPANWNLSIYAAVITSPSTPMFPALDLQIAQPNGAVSYGKDIYLFSTGRYDNKTFLFDVDINANLVTLLDNSIGGTNNAGTWINAAPFRIGTGTNAADYMVWFSETGVWKFPLSASAANRTIVGNAWTNSAAMKGNGTWYPYNYKPVWLDDATQTAGASSPQYLYGLACVFDSSNSFYMTGGLNCLKVDMVNKTYAQFGVPFDFRNTNIVNSAAFQAFLSISAPILHVQWNPIKQRLYLICAETGFIHVFTINTSNIATWWAMPASTSDTANINARAALMTYVKTITFVGGAGAWTGEDDCRHEHYCVEFDLTTGQEYAITCTRRNNDSYTGTVSRSQWVGG